MDASTPTREEYHEAGHCVVALALDYHVTWVQMSGGGGNTICEKPPLDTDDQVCNAIVHAFAGMRAEIIHEPQWEPRAMACIGDLLVAGGFVPQLKQRRPPLELCSELIQRADRLLRTNWPAVERIAAALHERGRLHSEEVKRLFRGN